MFDKASQCNICYVSQRCPGYEEGAVCKYNEQFMTLAEPLGRCNLEDLVAFLVQKMQMDAARYVRAAFYEALDGGLPCKTNQEISSQLSSDTRLLAWLLGVIPPEEVSEDY